MKVKAGFLVRVFPMILIASQFAGASSASAEQVRSNELVQLLQEQLKDGRFHGKDLRDGSPCILDVFSTNRDQSGNTPATQITMESKNTRPLRFLVSGEQANWPGTSTTEVIDFGSKSNEVSAVVKNPRFSDLDPETTETLSIVTQAEDSWLIRLKVKRGSGLFSQVSSIACQF